MHTWQLHQRPAAREVAPDPTPQEIAAMCARIQRGWREARRMVGEEEFPRPYTIPVCRDVNRREVCRQLRQEREEERW